MNYHLARLRAVQEELGGDYIGIEIVGGEGDAEYKGLPFRDDERDGLNIITLFPNQDFSQLSILQISQRLLQTLQQLSPECVALCGYHRVENLVALSWAKSTSRSAILMIASKQDDAPRHYWQEWLKGLIVKQFDGYLVGGSTQRQYMSALGAPDNRIFEGYDVVDNALFAEAAAAARQNEQQLRLDLGLPSRYFMAACRFVSKKNLPLLLEAYHLYRQTSTTAWSLVICGGGPLEAEVRQIIKDQQIPDVLFPGFHKSKELGTYYGLASCFILPSIQEQWGLVVNEAMAAGLPVLVSQTSGCAPDLVQEGVNGSTFDPTNSMQLAELMEEIAQSGDSLNHMGTASQKLIERHSPDVFGKNLVLTMKAAQQRT